MNVFAIIGERSGYREVFGVASSKTAARILISKLAASEYGRDGRKFSELELPLTTIADAIEVRFTSKMAA